MPSKAGFTPLQSTLVKKRRFVTGFSLAEVLVSVFILGLLITGVYAVLNVGNTAYLNDMGLLDLEQGIRQAMNFIVKELRASSAVTIDAGDSGHITFTTPTLSNIEYRHIDSNGDGTRDRIIRQLGGTTRILANDISHLCFCWDAVSSTCLTNCTDIFTIRIRAAKTVIQRSLEFVLIERVRTRN